LDSSLDSPSIARPDTLEPGRLRRVIHWLGQALQSDLESTADRRIERLAKLVTLLSTLWFALAACWEMAGPFGAGHVASTSAIGLAAENMWKWHVLGPVAYYTQTAPTPAQYYCNHPWGIFWTTAVAVKTFGHHDFVCRLPPIVMSTLTPPLLYGIARRLYGPIAGAIAAASFVVTPIALAFANFNNLEVPVIFGVCLGAWSYLRLTETWRRRWVALSAFGFLYAFNSDWSAFFFGAPLLVFMLFRGILGNGRWYPAVDRRRFAQWWALSSSAAVAVVVFYLWQFQRAGALGNLLAQGVRRSLGDDLPLHLVLESRADWIETAFTPVAIFMGKLALPLIGFRLLFLRKDREIFPLAVFFMAVVQYVVFKQGADIHFFWPHLFAPYFALAMAALAGTFEGVVRAAVQRFRRTGRVWPPIAAFVGAIWVPLSMIPDGVNGLVSARETGGRYDERGDLIHQDVDKITVLKNLSKRFESGTSVGFHDGMFISWNVDWTIRRPSRVEPLPTKPAFGNSQYYVLDCRFVFGKELASFAQRWHVEAYGPYWFVDRGAGKGNVDGFTLVGREPKLWEWYFVQGNDPIYHQEADPYFTWELRQHFAQSPNPAPSEAPNTYEQKRIAHNLAVANGDIALADRLLGEMVGELDRTPAVDYADGTRLLGVRVTSGVAPKLEVYFLASRPIAPDAMYYITSQVTEVKRWSWVPAPSRTRSVGMPFEMPTSLWQKGFVYRSVSEIRARPGTEVFIGYWGARLGSPKLPQSGGAPTVLHSSRR
jgi:Dolichyl-phosphate-mannose-protein mannosyltransferase